METQQQFEQKQTAIRNSQKEEQIYQMERKENTRLTILDQNFRRQGNKTNLSRNVNYK